MHDLPDHELILKYRESRNTEVIAILFQRYTHLVYGVCLKYLKDQDDHAFEGQPAPIQQAHPEIMDLKIK